jgi:hypothetical protein
VLILLAWTGCASMNATSGDAAAGSTPYKNFVGVLYPEDLKVVSDRTYLVETSGITTGILTLKGWVERDSLVDFFRAGMKRQGWRELAVFKSPQANTSSILVFLKADRTSVINIHEELIYTYVEIAVAPTTAPAAGGVEFRESTAP